MPLASAIRPRTIAATVRSLLFLLTVGLTCRGAGNSTTPSHSNVIGAAVRVRPAYHGSSHERVDAVPILDYDNGIAFARSVHGVFEGGAHISFGTGWTAGVQVAWEESRKSRESSLLRARNVPDLSVGASVGPHIEWRGGVGPSPVLVIGRFRHHLDTDRGWQADLRATFGIYRSGPIQAGLFCQATSASHKATRTLYGTPGFDPDGGLLFVSAGLLASYDLPQRWALFGSVEIRQLQGDAARSVLAERKSAFYGALGVGRRF